MGLSVNGVLSDNISRLGYEKASRAIRAYVAELHLSSTENLWSGQHRM
jgi:hypothetical protein